MIHRRWPVALCFAAFVTGATSGRAVDLTGESFSKLSAEEKALLREYEDHYNRLKEFYENITIEAQQKVFGIPRAEGGAFPPAPSAKPELLRTTDYVFRARQGTHYRLEGADRFAIVTPGESYLFGVDRETGRPYLTGHGKERDRYVAQMNAYAFQIAPIGIGSVLLYWQVFPSGKGKTIEQVRLGRDESGEEVVTISAVFGSEGGQQQKETYQLYRNRSWAVKEAHEQFGEQGEFVRTYHCSYKGEANGFPLLSEYISEARHKDPVTKKERLQKREVFAIKAIVPGAPDASYFDATPLLNKEDVGPGRSPSAVNVWLAISGVLLLLLSIFLSRKRRPVLKQPEPEGALKKEGETR